LLGKKCDHGSSIISLSSFRAGSTSAMTNGDDWCIGGRVVMMTPEIIVAEFPCDRFRSKPPLKTQAREMRWLQ